MGNMHGKFGEVWGCDPRDMRADRQTDRQTDDNISLSCRSGVNKNSDALQSQILKAVTTIRAFKCQLKLVKQQFNFMRQFIQSYQQLLSPIPLFAIS